MLGNISNKPWDAVYVEVNDPAWSEPWTAPAAPPSDCNSLTKTSWPKIFFLPWEAQASMCSAIGEEGVIG